MNSIHFSKLFQKRKLITRTFSHSFLVALFKCTRCKCYLLNVLLEFLTRKIEIELGLWRKYKRATANVAPSYLPCRNVMKSTINFHFPFHLIRMAVLSDALWIICSETLAARKYASCCGCAAHTTPELLANAETRAECTCRMQ